MNYLMDICNRLAKMIRYLIDFVKVLKLKMKFSKVFTVLAIISVLSIGCFAQIYYICKLYFSYSTNVEIVANFNRLDRDVPALTFCSSHNFPVRGRTTQQLFSHFNISDIIKNVSITSLDRSKEEELTNRLLKNVKEVISLSFYCFTLDLRSNASKTRTLYLDQIIKIDLNTIVPIEGNRSWWIFFHHSLDRPSSYEWNAIEVTPYWNDVSYRLITYKLLEDPYPTNCMDYNLKTQHKSSKECIRKCKLDSSRSKCGAIPHEVDVLKHEPSVRFVNTSEEEKCIKQLNLKKMCSEMCDKVDCEKHFYRPIIISNRKGNQNTITIELIQPSEPETVMSHKPSIELIEFLCYVASILSLWFGFSLFSLFFWFKQLIAWFKSSILLFNFENNNNNNVIDFEFVKRRPNFSKRHTVLYS